MFKYKVTRKFTIDGKDYLKDELINLSDEDADSHLDNGSLILNEVDEEVVEVKDKDKKPESDLRHPSKGELASIKAEAKEAKEAGEAADPVTNEERNFNTGVNVIGVNSPDPIVGKTVPVDMVMPGQVVDPKTGKVLDGGGADLSTPQPNPPTDKERRMSEIREAKEEDK